MEWQNLHPWIHLGFFPFFHVIEFSAAPSFYTLLHGTIFSSIVTIIVDVTLAPTVTDVTETPTVTVSIFVTVTVIVTVTLIKTLTAPPTAKPTLTVNETLALIVNVTLTPYLL